MSIFKTAYDTTACRGYVTTKIKEGLQKAMIQYHLEIDPRFDIAIVTGGHHVDELVPTFNHPIVFTDSSGNEKIAIDVRGLGRHDKVQGEFVVRDSAAYDTAIRGAVALKEWLKPTVGTDVIRNISTFPLSVYANWMGEVIGKRLALEPGDQFTVSVLAAIFYLNLFWSDDKSKSPDKIDKNFLVSQITRAVFTSKSTEIFDIAEAHGGISTVEDFCQACKDYTQSVRMSDLNAAVLFAVVGGYWYGTNGRELIAVALEHPPTWLNLLYTAIHHRGFKNAGLTKVVERGHFKRLSQQFSLSYANLTSAN